MNTGDKPNSDGGDEFGCSASEFQNRIRMLKTFGDRVRFVIGAEQWTPWAIRHGIAPSTVDGWLNKGVGPYKKTLTKLEEATGIPAAWWKSGEGPPPERHEDEPGRPGSGDARAKMKKSAWRASEDDRDSACQEPCAAYPVGARPADGLTWGTNSGAQSSVVMPLAMRIARAIESTEWLPASRSPRASLLLMRETLDLLLAAAGNQPQRLEAITSDPAALDGMLRLAWALVRADHPPAGAQNGGNP